MSDRITNSNLDGAFKRLHSAMEWPNLLPWNKISRTSNVGAIYLADNGYSFAVEQISNEGGGVHTLLGPWGTKRGAFEGMVGMAQAVEMFKG